RLERTAWPVLSQTVKCARAQRARRVWAQATRSFPLDSEPWQFLYFLPEPHGQGSLRPTLRSVRTNVPCTSGCGGGGGRAAIPGGRWMWLPRFRCRLLHVPGEQRGKLGVLRLKRTHRALLPLQSCRFLAIDLFLGAHFELGENGDRLELDPIEHRREQLERLALVLEAIVLLRIAAQMNALAQVIHRRQVLAPVLIEHAQHHI